MSLVSHQDNQSDFINTFSAKLDQYFTGADLRIIDSSFEKDLLANFELLAKLRNFGLDTSKQFQKEYFYRYEHTLLLLENLSALLSNDYQKFIRLDECALKRGEKILSLAQIKQIVSRVQKLLNTPEKRLFMTLLAITHDYGCLVDFPTHFVISGQLCRKDFAKFGLDENLASLIVGNHSYFGDLLLGEGTIEYIKNLRIKNNDLNFQKFWQYLWLLNLLDINATRGGFLSANKYEKLANLYDIDQLAVLEQNFLQKKLEYLFGSSLTNLMNPNLIDENFAQVYSQYFNHLINQPVLKMSERVALINTITEFWLVAREKIVFEFLAFSSDNQVAAEDLISAYQKFEKREMFDLSKKTFLGFSFSLENGYLRVANGNRY